MFAALLGLSGLSSPAFAATSQELYRALGLEDAEVTAHSLATTTETSIGTCAESTVNAISDPDAGEALLSNGLAAEGGTGDFDWPCNAGQGLGFPDATQFQLTLEIPDGSRSFLFRAAFATTEVDAKPQVDDRAMVFVDWPDRAPVEIDLSRSQDLQDAITPWRSYALDVEGVDSLDLSFRIEDNVEGRNDSALRLGDFRFSDEPAPSDFTKLGQEDQKLPPSSYTHSQTLLSIPGRGIPLDFTIHYNARNLRSRYFFRKWTHSYEWSLRETTSDDGDPQLLILSGDGGGLVFCESPGEANLFRECNASQTTSFDSVAEGRSGTVTRLGNGSYEYLDRSQMTYAFSSTGLLQEIRDLNGNRLQFTHFDRFDPRTLLHDRSDRLSSQGTRLDVLLRGIGRALHLPQHDVSVDD
jgi:hypothetical protein